MSPISNVLSVNHILLYVSVSALFSLWFDKSYAQGCCTVGASSIGGVESGVQKYQTLSFGINYQFNSVTRAYEETKRIEDPLRRTASVGYFNIHAEYGLQPHLSFYALLYFGDKTREITVRNVAGGFTETGKFSASGIGDLTLLAKYQVVTPSITSPFELALGVGASLPTGSFTKEQNNAELSIDLQPGTGATTLIVWTFAMRSFPASGIRLFATTMYRYSGTNFNSYRLGDEFLTTMGGEYSFSEHFGGLLMLRSRYALQDFSNRRTLSATGGTYHDLMPSISYYDGPSQFRVFSQLPVYRNVRGIQLTLAYLLGVEYSYAFDFSDSL
jgi:hypothetical protein